MSEQTNVSNHVYDGFATVLRLLVLASIAVGIVLLARIIFLFFGTLKTVPGYDLAISITEPIVAPLKSIQAVKTPYDGQFDIAATGMLIIALVIEFVFQSAQHSLEKQSIKSARAAQAAAVAAAQTEPQPSADELVKK